MITQQDRATEIAKYETAYLEARYEMRQWRRDDLALYLQRFADPSWRSVLDVGCGRGQTRAICAAAGLTDWRGLEVVPYLCGGAVEQIPGMHALGNREPADLVLCTDVLEHVLEGDVDAGLLELARMTKRAAYLTISHKPAPLLHVTVHPWTWWEPRIAAAFGVKPRVVDNPIPEWKRPCTHVELRRA